MDKCRLIEHALLVARRSPGLQAVVILLTKALSLLPGGTDPLPDPVRQLVREAVRQVILSGGPQEGRYRILDLLDLVLDAYSPAHQPAVARRVGLLEVA